MQFRPTEEGTATTAAAANIQNAKDLWHRRPVI